MSGWGSSAREGLSSRPNVSDQVQINIEKFDFDSEVEGLRAHVGKIKQMSLAIDDERKQQGEIIGSLEEAMERASLTLKRTMGRLNVAYKQAQSNHLLALVIFAVFLFIAIYIISKVYRIGKSIVG